MAMPAIDFNISPARCPVPACPEDPKLIVPGFALASAINSFTEVAGSPGCTISASGLLPINATGLRSLLREGKVYMPFGSPGNDVQPQAMTQVFLNIVLWGMDPQAAVEAPRFSTFSFPASSAPHDYHPGRLNLESRFDRATTDALAALGHKVAPWGEIDWHAGAVCAIRVNPETGLLEGGADPRRPCYALGV